MDILLYTRRLCLFLENAQEDCAIPVYQDNTSTIKMEYMGSGSSHGNNKFLSTSGLRKISIQAELYCDTYLTESIPADLFASSQIGRPFYKWRDIVMCDID